MEIVLDDLFGFLVLDIHALCQSESGNTIDDSELRWAMMRSSI